MNNQFGNKYISIFLVLLLILNSCKKEDDYDNKIPEVVTNPVINIVELTAEGGGVFLTGLNTVISAYGICYSTFQNPTIVDSLSEGIQVSVTKVGNKREEKFTCELSGLQPNSTYYVKAFATNAVGTGYGNEVSFSTPSLQIGQNYGGGIVFYTDDTGIHGLISATSDQSINTQWFNGRKYIVTGATGTSVGDGLSNTIKIVNEQGEGNYAALICYDLELNGFDDWFLPSKDELNLMYQQKDIIGGFSSDFYWSSTEHGEGSAWEQVFNSGEQYYVNKNSHIHVRAIRSF